MVFPFRVDISHSRLKRLQKKKKKRFKSNWNTQFNIKFQSYWIETPSQNNNPGYVFVIHCVPVSSR